MLLFFAALGVFQRRRLDSAGRGDWEHCSAGWLVPALLRCAVRVESVETAFKNAALLKFERGLRLDPRSRDARPEDWYKTIDGARADLCGFLAWSLARAAEATHPRADARAARVVICVT